MSINLLKELRRFYKLKHQVLPHLAYSNWFSSGQNNIITPEIAKKSRNVSKFQLNLQKHVNICCCSFNKIPIEKKSVLQKIDFFWPNSFGAAHGISVKFCLWTFHKLKKHRKIDFYWLLVALGNALNFRAFLSVSLEKHMPNALNRFS